MRGSLLLIFCFAFAIRSLAQEKVSVEQVIAMALEQNYDIIISKNEALVAGNDQKFAFGAFLPRVNATGSILWNRNDQTVRVLDRETNVITERKGTSSSNSISSAVLLNWTLFDGGRMFATRERVNLIADQGELLVKNQIVNTIASVISNYYDVVRQKQQLKAILDQMSVNEVRVKLAERKFQVGTGAKPELLQARVDYNAQRAQAIQQESVIAQLKAQLNSLVGLRLPEQFDISDSIAIDMSIKKEDVLQKSENNFGLQAINQNIGISSLTVKERRAERFPTIEATSAYNFGRTDNTRIVSPFSPLFSLNNGFNYGFTISIPILNGFNQKRLITQARFLEEQSRFRFQQQKIIIDVSLENAYTNYENAKRILEVEEENILLAQENVTIALEVFRRGASTFVELRTAQQSLADAYTRLINARYLAKVAETELLRLNGALLK
jgi:outer membrane protein